MQRLGRYSAALWRETLELDNTQQTTSQGLEKCVSLVSCLLWVLATVRRCVAQGESTSLTRKGSAVQIRSHLPFLF